MTATVYYDSVNEIALISNTFLNTSGVPADPATVSCVITDPSDTSVTHTYAGASPADITKVSTGRYTLAVPCSPAVAGVDGLWGYEWIGTGLVSDVQPGTWRVLPANVSQLWYVGLEEMNDRLGITDTADSYAMQTAIATSAGWINEYCQRHFNRVTETRTFVPYGIYELDTDDIVPGTAIALSVDYDGDGIYEQAWVQGTDYQLYFGKDRFNLNSTGIARPYEKIRVINSGRTFPFLWPFAPLNRVQIATTWGWPQVPWQVAEANRILAADMFKMKDAPFGLAGSADLGVVRVQSNPWLTELLSRFIKGTQKVGV
jgi:hypothetical protein